ncbi:MAG TPA: PQQ-binding-like beta-propeller repeat protein, partial [Pirellulales bacterium]|nr:PQQ-binding-like beta-propeller repeat protein [Pirellulales bacterium]
TGTLTTFRLPAPNRAETPGEQALKDSAFNYSGKGVADAPPVVTEGAVFWGTDVGNIYAVNPEKLEAQFRVKTRGAVLARLTYRAPYVYGASRDGYVYAIEDLKGVIRWKASVGNPIVEQPMVTDDGVYAIPEIGGLCKLSLETGDVLWRVSGPLKFLSASPTRLYTADRAGRMLIFDARTGARVAWLPAEQLALKVFNRENDRIYLATLDGLVQCLHETGLRDPVWHIGPREDPGSTETEEPAGADSVPGDNAPAVNGPDPFAEGDGMENDADADSADGDDAE